MHHIVIGAGPAGISAIETIRQLESARSRITLVSDEPAHSRMVLPYWLSGQVPRAHTQLGDARYFDNLGVESCVERRLTSIQPAERTVVLDDGSTLAYDTLLLATGSQPMTPPIVGADLPGVQPMWSLRHVERALDSVESVATPRAVLIGAGFVGLIVLSAMHKRGWSLAVVEQQERVLPRVLDSAAASLVERWLAAHDVDVRTGVTADSIRAERGAKRIDLSDGSSLTADLVVVATGVIPNKEIAGAAGIATDLGILVDDHLRTNVPSIFAAGDVAQGPALLGGPPVVHAIQPTAVDHGRVAGANMAGLDVRYPGSLSMNVLNVLGLQCAGYGNCLDETLPAVKVLDQRRLLYRKLVWRDDRLVGAILTGQPGDVGMLSDLGMIKGLIQTQMPLGRWRSYLMEHPFDVRRVFVALNVASRLLDHTLLGRPSSPRHYRFHDAAGAARRPHHALLFDSRSDENQD